MMRVKYCKLCKKEFPVMFRIQYNSTKKWVFACENCLLEVKKSNSYLLLDVIPLLTGLELWLEYPSHNFESHFQMAVTSSKI